MDQKEAQPFLDKDNIDCDSIDSISRVIFVAFL